jgi:diaminohydroxyphosphoribosylaminopyrimidine deaminase/5-amino-6-(5-phosphoribosylamino)uracil reductase
MTGFSAIDHLHMAHALRLAEHGLYTTKPNPRVGCVIAHGVEVVGTGWHRRAGEAHAEVRALREAGARALGATAYVTLEPCAHQGRTPPCADALIAAGVARVVAASADPFARVDGRGIGSLRAAGIAVEVGLLGEEARALNPGFFSRIERGRPWLRLKQAISLDGRTALANGRSQWITGAATRADVQRWRARSSAILTGSGTVLADDPRLTVRLPHAVKDSLSPGPTGGEGWGEGAAFPVDAAPGASHEPDFMPPLRVLLDRRLRTPAASHVLDGSVPTLVVQAADAACIDERFARVERVAVAVHDGRLDLPAVLAMLATRGCNEVQVEAGPTLGGALFAAGLVDELLLYVAPLLLGDAALPLLHLPALADMAGRWQLQLVEQRMLGADWRLRLRPAPTPPK